MIAVANYDYDKASLESLRQHLDLRSTLRWDEVWHQIADNGWFQSQLNRSAMRAIKSWGLPVEWKDDIKQEALLELARALKRDKTLGFDERRGSLRGFLATIIYRNCQKGLRQFRRANSSARNTGSDTYLETDALDEQLDLQESVQKLKEPFQTTLRLISVGRSIREIAEMSDCSERTIYRRLEKGIQLLRERLDPLSE